MNVIDSRGRLFGRLNIVDASVLAVAIVLLPLAYGTYMLFRPANPVIDSVSPSEITGAERRVSNGSALAAKFKIRGSGLTPLLRARIGDQDAIGLVFESPQSADVLVGPVPPGNHDLILLDGIQEVARANGAIEIQAATGTPIRVSGWLLGMDKAASGALAPGRSVPVDGLARFDVIAVGIEQPARSRMRIGDIVADGEPNGLVDREALLTLRCDAPPLYEACSIGGAVIAGAVPMVIALPGSYRFELHEVLPMSAPATATATVRVEGPAAALVRAGDRDALLDGRRAVVTAVTARSSDAAIVTLRLGVDESREGWRYRGRLLRPGGPLAMRTDRYDIEGRVLSLTVQPGGAK